METRNLIIIIAIVATVSLLAYPIASAFQGWYGMNSDHWRDIMDNESMNHMNEDWHNHEYCDEMEGEDGHEDCDEIHEQAEHHMENHMRNCHE